VYHLSGWLPEYLDISMIDDFDDLWNRISENFEQGNTIFFLEHVSQNEIFPVIEFSGIEKQNLGTRTIKLVNLDANVDSQKNKSFNSVAVGKLAPFMK
jgi:hypothetical protein